MKVWGGGDKVMETGSSMGIWDGVGWLEFEVGKGFAWLWSMEE